MSVTLMGAVWQAAKDGVITDRLDLLTLLALADRCDDHGYTLKHSTMKELAAKSLCDKRSMVRVVKRLEQKGFLEVVRSGGGRPRSDLAHNEPRGNTYRLIVSRLSGGEQGAAVCRADGPKGSRAADRAMASGRRDKVEGSATCGVDEARGVSHSVPIEADEMVTPCHRFSFGENGDKGDRKMVTRVTGGARKKELLKALHSAEGVNAGASREVTPRGARFKAMTDLRTLWRMKGPGPLLPVDLSEQFERMSPEVRDAQWMRPVGVLLDRMGPDWVQEAVRRSIEANEGAEGVTLWDVLTAMLRELPRGESHSRGRSVH